MSFIEDRIPRVYLFVILNISVSFDSGCHGNQDRKCHEICIFFNSDPTFNGNSYHKCSKCHISETGDIIFLDLALKIVLKKSLQRY